MKKLILPISLTLLLLGSCQDEMSPASLSTLSKSEIETLLFTREEEKLAHDVYTYAFEKYGVVIFQNIANSESQHTASILALMNSYQINDPLDGNASQGYFVDPVIKELYIQLTSRVDLSLEEAIKVGLLIEDMDIYDLEMGIVETTDAATAAVYSKLKCGSENHLRSFYSQASLLGISYAPDYISQAYFDSIVNSPRTSCQPS
jgi:hypothetical protein